MNTQVLFDLDTSMGMEPDFAAQNGVWDNEIGGSRQSQIETVGKHSPLTHDVQAPANQPLQKITSNNSNKPWR
jgi:hypothetical protein